MTHEELSEASELVRRAADATDDADSAETLTNQADQLDRLAERDRGPDHGRIARHQHALRDVQDELDGEPADLLAEANERLNAYRSTVEGV